jgi:microcystin-dependent protein
MSNQFVGEIQLVAYNFAPKGFAFCAGQLLPISQNTALFSLLGTFYGGDGKSTFALPNLQGQSAIGQGQGPGLTLYNVGDTGGSETVTLLNSEIPSHTHTMPTTAALGRYASPGSTVAPGSIGRGKPNAYANIALPSTTSMAPCQAAGGNLPHNNMMPYLVLNYVIALQGIYPPRS